MPRMAVVLFLLSPLAFAQTPIELSVDATDAPRRLFRARMVLPVSSGTVRLAYPKWIPGEHSPTGPIADLVGLRVTAGDRALPWRRDPLDMNILLVEVPAGVSRIEIAYDFLSAPNASGFSSGGSATTEMMVLSWNQVLLYPLGASPDSLSYHASLKVPSGWRFGTALPIERESGETIEFRPAPLTTLVDSPVIAGRYFKTLDLTPGAGPAHFVHLAADSRPALELPAALVTGYQHLVAETGALFGARHYRSYHFLVSLSDHVAHFGLEHHESSDDRMPEFSLADEESRPLWATLLSHEMTHSWNGKYRRPAGLITSDYQKPMDGELLWIYEGLTTYLGNILAPRSGLLTPEQYRQSLAMDAAALDSTPGRRWRPLADTAVAAQLLYEARGDRENLRRGVDFYPEGDLIWLEADVIIRRESKGQRSLDDFCRRFHGGASGPPQVRPYTLADVIAELQAVQSYEWRSFFDQRVYRVADRPPLGGITGSGWRLVYREEPTAWLKAHESHDKTVDVRYSLGLEFKEDGTISDVITGSPADQAGMAPSGTLLAVNGRQFAARALRAAIKAAKDNSDSLELIVKDGEQYKTYRAQCHTGERYPDLERDPSVPDVLTAILSPRAPQ